MFLLFFRHTDLLTPIQGPSPLSPSSPLYPPQLSPFSTLLNLPPLLYTSLHFTQVQGLVESQASHSFHCWSPCGYEVCCLGVGRPPPPPPPLVRVVHWVSFLYIAAIWLLLYIYLSSKGLKINKKTKWIKERGLEANWLCEHVLQQGKHSKMMEELNLILWYAFCFNIL